MHVCVCVIGHPHPQSPRHTHTLTNPIPTTPPRAPPQIKFDKVGMPSIEDVVSGLCLGQVQKLQNVEEEVRKEGRRIIKTCLVYAYMFVCAKPTTTNTHNKSNPIPPHTHHHPITPTQVIPYFAAFAKQLVAESDAPIEETLARCLAAMTGRKLTVSRWVLGLDACMYV